jgi:hypothetical protein
VDISRRGKRIVEKDTHSCFVGPVQDRRSGVEIRSHG